MKKLTEYEMRQIYREYNVYWRANPDKGVNEFWDSRIFNKLLKELEIEKCDELLTYLFEEL